MYYITKEKLIEALQELPPGTEIAYIGRGYKGSTQYLTIGTSEAITLKEIVLDRRDNDAD